MPWWTEYSASEVITHPYIHKMKTWSFMHKNKMANLVTVNVHYLQELTQEITNLKEKLDKVERQLLLAHNTIEILFSQIVDSSF